MKSNFELRLTNLRCEYKINPLGIDLVNPRLSWIIESISSTQYSQYQSAYQIIVSSSLENLNKNIADFWNTDKILSQQQNQIKYCGKKLLSKDECWWKVKIWDKYDQESEWSEPACWTMGLLNRADWKAKWIGFDEWKRNEDRKDKFEFESGKDKWIWFPLSKTENGKGIGEYFFRKKIFIKNYNEISSAKILIAADEKYEIFINGKFVGKSDDKIFSWARPKLIDAGSTLKPNDNIIAVKGTNTYLQKPGLAVKLFLTYMDGRKKILSDNEWKACDELKEHWMQAEVDDRGWEKAEVTAVMGEQPWGIPKVDLILPPPPYLRKEFTLKKQIKKAAVFISALGLYKLFINGNKISGDRLTPGWTDYTKRVYYNTYNVKEYLNLDTNCLGIILADGWYAGYIGWEKQREYYGKNPRVILQLEVEYEDGTKEIIGSDESWKASYGSITEADLLMGETYDARKEIPGWNKTNFDESRWDSVDVNSEINTELNSYPGIPIRKTLEIKPVKITSPKKEIHIFDLGQNFAGFVRIKINGKKSDKISLRFGEMLDEEGNLYVENIRMARAADTYFAKGEDEEIWEPEFTYHGFRYVEVGGLNEEPTSDAITGIVFHSDLPITGDFICSNKKLNKLYQSILWSQRSNFMDIPTDCPQRDERLGWTADAVDFVRTASFNMETASFYTKWLRDLNDAQENDGAYTAIAPKPDLGVGPLYSGAAGFADAGIITPYYLYRFYNDISILKKYYKNMQLFMEYLEANDYKRPGTGYGDWLSHQAETPKELIDAAFFAFDAKLMSEISALLNRKNEVDRYQILYEKIRKYFVDNFVYDDSSIKSGTQTAYVLPLFFGLLDKKTEQKSLTFLVDDIEKRDWHVSAGFIGLTYLFPVLTKFGRSDIVYKLLLNELSPSWLNMINNGATTMWERWDSWSQEKGFFDPLMNSFNHTSLGVIGEWFYSGIGGIIPEEPGFRRVLIKPQFGGGLKFAKVFYKSLVGDFSVHWKIEKEALKLKIRIPVNCYAKVILPKNINKKVLNNLRSETVIDIIEKDKEFFFEVGSGDYIINGTF